MFLTIMLVLANIFYVTWFIWPIAFVYSLAHGIKTLLKNEDSLNIGLGIASVSLIFIVSGLLYPILA